MSPLGITNSKQKWEEDIKCALTFTICVMILKLLCVASALDPAPASAEQKALSETAVVDCVHTGKNWWDAVIAATGRAERSGL